MTIRSATAPTPQPLAETLVRVRPALERILGAFTIPPEDAEDLLQECYLTLLYKQDEVRCPEAWLIGTLRKKCAVYWRSRRRQLLRAVEESLLDLLAEPGRPEQERRDLCRDLEEGLARLPARSQQLLRLRYVMGLRPGEVAERMGYRRSSIPKITSRCLGALSRELVAVGFLEEA